MHLLNRFLIPMRFLSASVFLAMFALASRGQSGAPAIVAQPKSLSVPFGSPASIYVGFTGEAPAQVFLLHAGTNLYVPPREYPTLTGAATNTYNFFSLTADAGDYQFIVSNRLGATASFHATVTVQPAPSATVVTALSNIVVGIGEFNFTNLRDGLVITNLSFGNTTHLLSMKVASSLPPFLGNVSTDGSPVFWQLSLAVSNQFVVQKNSGADAASGTWGVATTGANYLALSLTNFPRSGDISRLEAYDNGTYGIVVGGDPSKAQSGTYRVLGARRPSTNTFTVDLVGPTPVNIGWIKDGAPINTATRAYVTSVKANGVPPSGGINVRLQLTVPDLTPADAGYYTLRVTNLFPNPDTSFGQPLNIVSSVIDIPGSVLTIRGFTETNAPAVIGALELGSGTPTVLSVQNDGTFLLGAGTTMNLLTPLGQTNWVATLPALVGAAILDGQGGAFVGGADNDSGNFFLNRVRPSATVRGGAFVTTNHWTTAVQSPSTNFFENSSIPHGAEVTHLLPAADGVYVAGRFRGKSRFGSHADGPFSFVGGISITNVYDATFGSNDRSWDLFLAKYDFAGQIVWVRGYGGTNTETLTSFTTDAAGDLFLAGSFQGGAQFGSVAIESTKKGTSFSTDGFVAKVTPTGDPIWVKTFGGLSDTSLAKTVITSAVTDPDGNVYIFATRDQAMLTLPIGASVGNRFIARLNTDGDMLWAQTVATAGNSRLAIDPSGDVVLLDAFITGASNPTLIGAGTIDRLQGTEAVLAKITRGGTLYWARGLGEKLPFADIPRGATASLISMAPSGELYVAGAMSAGTTDALSKSAGERFDTFELTSTNSATGKPNVGFVVRLAPTFVPSAPVLTLVSATDRTGLLQDALILEGRATGVGAPLYQWLLNGQPLLNATNRELIFSDLERTNRGTYVLVASNAFGVAQSAPIQLTPQLRPNMTDWTLVTATTNYAGLPSRVGADDAGNSYILLDGVELRHFDRDGKFLWRFDAGPRVEGKIDGSLNSTFILSSLAPVVAPGGEIFVAGRIIVQPKNSSSTAQGNFIGRLDPGTGSFIWVKDLSSLALGQLDSSTIRGLDLDGAGHLRALISDKHLRVFSFDGTEAPIANLAVLPILNDAKNYRFAVDSAGGIYFYANRIEALNLGATNLPALGGTGAQTYVLARYDSAGVYQWHRAFTGPGGIVLTPAIHADANGNAVISGALSLSGAQTLQIGTNILTGSGYAAKVSSSGDVLWAKAWWLDVCDSALKADGSIYLTGWFRFAPAPSGGTTRRITFGTNIVSGSSVTGHDQFVAKLNTDGQEQFIRQTGGPQFYTEDNAYAYYLTVDTKGIVTTAGYTRVPRAGGILDLGAVQMIWPAFPPTSSEYQAYYVARLEAGVAPSSSTELAFTPPAPGTTTMQFTWPSSFFLQRKTVLDGGAWETLNVTSPYNASLLEFVQGYFRVTSAP